MKKKSIIILASVVVVCALGLLISTITSWPVNVDDASGNIGKSSRFSRKTATESLTNMEELLNNDEAYKDGILMSFAIMQARARQFAALVDMSNEVASDIPAFSEVLKDMNEAAPIIENACLSIVQAGNDLNATLDGESCPDLGQNTINASLAYTTLQKQNVLATRFINTTDEYLKEAEADDRLLLIRDQWLEYQIMTATLEGDTKSAEELNEKGALLSSEKALATLGSFEGPHLICMMEPTLIAHDLNVETPLSKDLPGETIKQFVIAYSSPDALAGRPKQNDHNGLDILADIPEVARLANWGPYVRIFEDISVKYMGDSKSLSEITSGEALCHVIQGVIAEIAQGNVGELGASFEELEIQ